jgi:hypothetical protein
MNEVLWAIPVISAIAVYLLLMMWVEARGRERARKWQYEMSLALLDQHEDFERMLLEQGIITQNEFRGLKNSYGYLPLPDPRLHRIES